MWPFKKKTWLQKHTERLCKGGPPTLITFSVSKLLCGMGIGVLLATYFPNAPKDGWVMWGWTLILFALVMAIPSLKAMFSNR